MSVKSKTEAVAVRERTERIVAWMSAGIYEKEQLAAMVLLCAVAGENVFLNTQVPIG